MKRLFRFIQCMPCIAFICGASVPAHAGLATVGAVHDYVQEKWGVEIPRTHTASNIITMTYLMQLVDAANFALNGWETSDYAADAKYATSALAATAAAQKAIDTLIKKECPPNSFCFTPETASTDYGFSISAAGNYTIDWGDGQTESIEKTDVIEKTYSHTYTDAANKHEIVLSGKATMYEKSEGNEVAAISFNAMRDTTRCLSAMRGCLGCVFSTIEDESVPEDQRQPRFIHLFRRNTKLDSEIPEGLFKGVYGAPIPHMFNAIFYECSSLRGTIPENLFDGIDGTPAEGTFYGTFGGCSGLTGLIPENLFSGLKGAPTEYLFDRVFLDCSNLTGEIPKNLFAGIKGPPALQMFYKAFSGCSRLSGRIPETLFDGIEPTGDYKGRMFYQTFLNCTGLTGPSAKIDGRYLYEIWPDVSGQQTYTGDTKLTDYACIPTGWGGPGTKAPGTCEPAEDIGGE